MYVYLANSPLVSQIFFTNSASLRMTTTKSYDFLNWLTQISSMPSASSVLNYSYLYNSANQRIRRTDPDNSYWRFGYDSLGQVTSGKHYWQDQTPVAGQQFTYAFDDIGNRTATSARGDQNGANLRSASYSANSLNQYTSRTVPGYLQVMGLEFATNPVTVSSSTAYRKGEYFEKELTVANSSSPVWQSVTVAASGETTVSGNVFVPKSSETFSFHLDGNQTADGRFNYVWDGENRLTAMNARTLVGPTNSLRFAYDWRGRRVMKQVFANTNWSGTATNDLRFAYDGWNLLGEITNSGASLSLVRSYAWGLDLSGSMQGAGGVGGLLVFAENSGATILDSHYAAFDGNGNVMGLINSADASQSGRYEYGPFGETIRATGSMVHANPMRASTKHGDEETGLTRYEPARYLSISGGVWLSRDPLADIGAVDGGSAYPTDTANPFGFVHNEPVSSCDPLGLYRIDFHFYAVYYLLRTKCYGKIDAGVIAHESQWVDDNPATDPINLGASGFYAKLAHYHFAGSSPTKATAANDIWARSQVVAGFEAWKSGSRGNAEALGEALHLYADSWSHAGFTAWDNRSINDHGGSIPLYVGHANVGMAPDLPYNNIVRATDAAAEIYKMIPDLCGCAEPPTVEDVSKRVMRLFRSEGGDEARVQKWKAAIRAEFGEDIDYKRTP